MKKVSKCVLIREKRIFLTKRGHTAPTNPNKWSCPGGGVEENESYEEAAVREMKEETNLEFIPGEVIFKKISEKKEAHFFLGEFSGTIIIQEEELDGYAWYTYEETKNLDVSDRYRELIEILKERDLL